MRGAARSALAGAVAVLATAAVAAATRVPYAADAGEGAVLRLSWRTAGERVEECRKLTEEELAALPIHMRRPEVCEGRLVPYRLIAEIDGRLRVDETVRAAGAREDRPLYVFREIPLPAGEHRLLVRFGPELGAAAARSDDAPALAAPIELQEIIRVSPGEVALVTYDPDRRALVTRLPAGR